MGWVHYRNHEASIHIADSVLREDTWLQVQVLLRVEELLKPELEPDTTTVKCLSPGVVGADVTILELSNFHGLLSSTNGCFEALTKFFKYFFVFTLKSSKDKLVFLKAFKLRRFKYNVRQ